MFIEKAIKIANKWRYLVLTCTLSWAEHFTCINYIKSFNPYHSLTVSFIGQKSEAQLIRELSSRGLASEPILLISLLPSSQSFTASSSHSSNFPFFPLLRSCKHLTQRRF